MNLTKVKHLQQGKLRLRSSSQNSFSSASEWIRTSEHKRSDRNRSFHNGYFSTIQLKKVTFEGKASFGAPSCLTSRRNFSGVNRTSCDAGDGNVNPNNLSTFYTETKGNGDNSSSVDETLSNLVQSSGSSNDLTVESLTESDLMFTPTWYNPVDQAVTLLNYVDSLHDFPFAFTIIGSTLFLRTALLPIFIHGQRNSSRLAHMTPELNVLKNRIEKLGKNVDMATQAKYSEEMRALFKKYGCNPLKGLIPPLVQMPLFMSMFFALRKMPDYFAENLSTGGILWFPDLTSADPLYILPVASAATFIATIEMSKKTLESTSTASQAQIMTNVFRGLGVIMIPMTMGFPSAVLSYWVTNNAYSMVQSLSFQNKAVRRTLGIWDPPKPVAGAPEPKGIRETISDMVNARSEKGSLEDKKEAMKKHNEEVEYRKLQMKVSGQHVNKKKKGKRKKRGNR